MSPLGIVQLVASIVSVAYASESRPDGGKQVRILGVPVYDSAWPGVKRRQARRAARQEARRKADHDAMLDHVAKVIAKTEKRK